MKSYFLLFAFFLCFFKSSFCMDQRYNDLCSSIWDHAEWVTCVSKESIENFDQFFDRMQEALIPSIEWYLYNGGDINYRNKKNDDGLLGIACFYGFDKLVKYLVEAKNANINYEGACGSPLCQACTCHDKKLKDRYINIIKLLISQPYLNYRLADDRGNTALEKALCAKFKEAFDLISIHDLCIKVEKISLKDYEGYFEDDDSD